MINLLSELLFVSFPSNYLSSSIFVGVWQNQVEFWSGSGQSGEPKDSSRFILSKHQRTSVISFDSYELSTVKSSLLNSLFRNKRALILDSSSMLTKTLLSQVTGYVPKETALILWLKKHS